VTSSSSVIAEGEEVTEWYGLESLEHFKDLEQICSVPPFFQ